MRYLLENIRINSLEDGGPGALAVSGSRIASAQACSVSFDLGGALVLPAFLNAHDHLELNGLPRTGRPGLYRNAREWFEDVRKAGADPAFKNWLALPLSLRLGFSGFLNLFNGCLTVSHHNPYYRWQLGWRFPVEVVRRYGWCHSLAIEPDPVRALRRTAPGAPFILHFAEGVDAEARAEWDRLLSLGLLTDRTLLVHAVALPPEAMSKIAAAGAGLVWCPSSNLFLFNRTLAVREALAAGVLMALGSDSTLSGEGGLLREIPRARQLAGLSGRELMRLVTEAPARLLRLTDRGSIRERLRADLLVLERSVVAEGFCPSILTPRSIALILRAGRPVLGTPDYAGLFEKLGVPFIPLRLGSLERLLDRRYANRFARIASRAEVAERLAGCLESESPRLDFGSERI